MSSKLLSFKFAPIAACSLDYFVTHTGVADAHLVFENIYRKLESQPSNFEMVYVRGPSGVGKTHLSYGFQEAFSAAGITSFVCEWNAETQKIHSGESVVSPESFIAIYQELKTLGGVCVVISKSLPERGVIDPHLGSRFLSGQMVQLEYPQEEELYPILRALLERHHLRLPEARLKNIIQKVPAIPMYFEEVSHRINEILGSGEKLTASKLNDVLWLGQDSSS